MQGVPNPFFNVPLSAVGSIDLDITGNWSLAALDRIVASSTDIPPANGVILYDTSRDSDGGEWRDRVSHTSLGKPPAFMGLIVEDGSVDTVTIRDLTDTTTPIFKAWTLTNPRAVAAFDGKIVIGTLAAGVVVIDLIADEVLNYDTTDVSRGDQLPADFDMSTVTWTQITTDGAIVDNTINDVAITVLPGAPIDTATGLPTPTIAVATDAGVSVINNNGTVADLTATSDGSNDYLTVQFRPNGDVVADHEGNNQRTFIWPDYQSDDGSVPVHRYAKVTAAVPILASTGTDSPHVWLGDDMFAKGNTAGITIVQPNLTLNNGMVAYFTKTYATGWMYGTIRGAWLSQTGLTDRSPHGNNLTHNGTVPTAAVATGAELLAHGVFSAANNFTAASNAEWDVITTGALTLSIWFKSDGNSAIESYIGFAKSGDTIRFIATMAADGKINCVDDGSTAAVSTTSALAYDNGVWHKLDFVRTSSTARALYIDGVLVTSNTTDAGSLTDTTNLPFAIGVDSDTSTTPATTSSLTLGHISAYDPSAIQVKKAYEDEKWLFRENADCLLNANKSNVVSSVAYDPDSDRLIVGTGDGTSFFRGLERVLYVDQTGPPTSDVIRSVAGAGGAYAIGTAAETVINIPRIGLREEVAKINAQMRDGSGFVGLPNDIAFNAGFGVDMTGENLIVQTYSELVMTRPGSFTSEAGYIDTAGTDADVIVDIEKNGTTIYATKPKFAASANTLTAGVLKTDGTEDYVSADRITFKVTQIGSTIAGQKLRFTVKGITT